MARAFPLGPTAIQNRGGLIYVLRIRKHIFHVLLKCFPDFVCADVACPDVPIFLWFHDIIKVSYQCFSVQCVCLMMTYSRSLWSCSYLQDTIPFFLRYYPGVMSKFCCSLYFQILLIQTRQQIGEVWLSEFSCMAFRQRSQHHQCGTCMRHRALIRALGGHSAARAAQQKLYHTHLRHQYCDRLVYWKMRADSRDSFVPVVTMVTDGMDQSKFCLPRHEAMRSKDFGSFIRPKLHISAIIAHGWRVIFQISPPDLPKDSNASIELISHSLTVLQKQDANLRDLHVNIQSDNTCRECKNSPMIRYLSSLVSSRTIRSAALNCLRSGHSHEDIDQMFGQLATFTLRSKDLQDPTDVKRCIQAFLDKAKLFEKERRVVIIDQTRDWKLDLMFGMFEPIV